MKFSAPTGLRVTLDVSDTAGETDGRVCALWGDLLLAFGRANVIAHRQGVSATRRLQVLVDPSRASGVCHGRCH